MLSTNWRDSRTLLKSRSALFAKLYPARRDIRASLLNGLDKTYVVPIEFIYGDRPKRLYFNLTAWADAIKAGA